MTTTEVEDPTGPPGPRDDAETKGPESALASGSAAGADDGPTAAKGDRPPDRGWRRRAWPLLPLVAAAALYVVSLQQFRLERIDGLGLFPATPLTYWIAGAVLLVGFGFLVGTKRRPSMAWGTAYLIVLVVFLHATTGFIEAHPRFPTAWTHAGFVDRIIETGRVAPDYDARYNWPGAFSLGAYVAELTGVGTARALLRWAPVLMNLLVLGAVRLIVQQASRDTRLQLTGMATAVLVGWVGQDYLAPQAVAFVAYLTLVGVLLRYFRDQDPDRPAWFSVIDRVDRRAPGIVRQQRLGELSGSVGSLGVGRASALYLIVLVVTAVLAFSHQMTPFVLASAALVLVLVGRVSRPLLPVTLVVGAVSWVAFGATTFLRSNLAPMIESLGDLRGSVDENVGGRVGGSEARELVLNYRMGLTAMVAVLALVGFVRQWRAHRADWVILALAVMPTPLLALNSYGGEVLLRVLLFVLPFLAVLAAFAFFREGTMRPRSGAAAFTVFALVALPVFVIARFGNESFERIYSGDIAAWDRVVEIADPDTGVIVLNFAGPWRYSGLLGTDYRVFPDERDGDPSVGSVDEWVKELGPGTLVLLGEGTARHGEVFRGERPWWQDRLADALLRRPGYEQRFREGSSRIIEWTEPEDES
jgi:hypothetical protein